VASVALEALAVLRTQPAREAIERRMADPRAELRVEAILAYASIGGDDVAARIVQELEAPDATVRRAALVALGQLRARQAVPAIIAAAADPKVRYQALETLGAMPDRRALAMYLDGLVDENRRIRDVSRRALSTLRRSIASDLRLLYKRNELPAPVRRELTRALSAGRESYSFLSEEPPAKLEPSVYAKYATDHRGDSARGQRLFADPDGIGCVKCHAVGGVGSTLGPDLLGVGAKYPRHELIRAVLEPSNRILTGYETSVVVTRSGKMHAGVVKSESPDGIVVTTIDGEVLEIPAEQIALRTTSPLSPMPNGLADGMTLQDFADIIAYLASLEEPPSSEGTSSP
jgi:putative heme-binding domain-containing protein